MVVEVGTKTASANGTVSDSTHAKAVKGRYIGRLGMPVVVAGVRGGMVCVSRHMAGQEGREERRGEEENRWS